MKVFIRLIKYIKPYWWRVVIAAIAATCVGATDGGVAYLIGPVLKRIFTEKNHIIFYLLPLGIFVLFLVRGLCRLTNDYFITTAGQLAVQDVRNEIYRRNLRLSLGFFHRETTGGLMSRVLSDVSAMQDGVANTVSGFFRDGVSAISLLGVVFYRNWQLAFIAVVVIPLTVYPAQKIGRRIKHLAREGQERMGGIAGVLQETFSGIKVIKAFGLEKREVEKFEAINRDFYHFIRRSIKYGALSTPIMELITSIGVAAVIWVGGAKVMRGEMDSADFISFVIAMGLMYSPVKKLIAVYNVIQRCAGASERVFEIIDAEPEIVEAANPISLERARGDVEFCNVSFCYGEEPILSNINVTAHQGEVIALVGPSGAGKTTMVSLILRFYEVTSGKVMIDGYDVRELRQVDLLRQIALVDQETMLFNDTLANNIRYGKPDADDSEVEAAARAAFAHNFISEMPEGYNTNIGDRGVRLSGGQRQRICIARAIMKNTPILILDEATSALDTESEQMVQKALNNLMANRTTFVIAHRLSTILHADKIVVLENGEIVETGRHAELLVRGGVYKKLYDMQFQS
jgi:subfamily B ATP-binding cassette protein MsbA